MTQFKDIKHIFFDLDDTLWDFERNSSGVLQQLYHEFELKDKLRVEFADFHIQYKTINSDLWKQYNRGSISKQELRNNRFHNTFRSFHYDNFEENMRMTEEYLLRSPHGTHLHEGCHEVLSFLQSKYKLHIITNGFSEVQSIKLKNCNLSSYFNEIIISEVHRVNKPDLRIFRISEELTGAKPQECLMIGDNYETDIEGASAAGWNTLWFRPNQTEQIENSLSSLLELKELL